MILEDLLIQSGVDYEHVRGDQDEVLMSCPFCTGSVDQSGQRKVFGMNLVSGKAHCFRCEKSYGSVVSTARALCKAWDIDFSWRLRLSASESDERAIKERKEPVPLPVGLPEEYEAFGDLSDEIEMKAFDYLYSRGITRKEIDEYKIGYAAAGRMAWRVLFPIIGEDGEVYGCAGRDFSGKSSVKYLNTDGIKLLFNGQHKAKTAIVVEGPVDTLSVARALRRNFHGMHAVGALGSAVTTLQIAQLSKYDEIIDFPDSDLAGIKGAIKRAEACAEIGMTYKVIVPERLDGSDPGMLPESVIADRIRTAKPWSLAEKMRLRLLASRW